MEIGVDFGGTKIAGGLLDNGKIIARYQLPTNADKGKTIVLKQLKAVIDELCKKQYTKGKKVTGIGIGVPGLFERTKIVLLPNVKAVNGVDVKKALRLKQKVVLENDARCFALAEATHGAAKGKKNVVGVILGTGVGSGIIIDGKAYRGAHAGAGEVGHLLFDTGLTSFSPLHKMGDWESLLSGPSIVRRHQARGGTEDHPAMIWNSLSPQAKETREETIRLLCVFFASLQFAFDPDVIVVGGGVSNLPFYDEVNTRLPNYNARPIVVKNKFGVDGAVIGAVVALRNA